MDTPYSYYPIPRTGVGFHDSAAAGSIPANVETWAQALAAGGVSVYKILADGTNKVQMAAALVRAGIVPIVRLYGEKPHPRLVMHPGWVRPYVDVGAKLFEWGNEPNIGSPEWENGTFPPRSDFGRLIGEQWLRNAAAIRAEGGIPMFVAMTPGGYHDHRIAYRQILEYLRGQGKLGTLEGAALAIHPRPHTVPPHVAPTAALTVAFKEYEWIAALFREFIGWVPPMYATEHGYSPGDSTPTGYPPIDEARAAAWNKTLFEMMNPVHADKCPPYLLGLCYWLETEGGVWVRDEAFKHRFPGEPRLWGQAFLGMSIGWDRRAYVTGGTVPPPDPPPDEPPPAPQEGPKWINFTPFVRERVTHIPATVAAGARYWRLKSIEYLDEAAANGTHHIYSMNPHDSRYSTIVSWANGSAAAPHEKPVGEPAANFPMFGEGFTARLQAPDPLPSDAVSGLGMYGNRHVSFKLVWEEVTKGGTMPPTITLTDRLAAALREEFGDAFEDLRGRLPVHETLRYNAIDSRGFDFIAIHHSETPKNRTWAAIAQYHISADPNRTPPKEPWAGIGYHMGVRQGTVSLFDSVDTERAHVYGMNHEALGVCVTGQYDTTALDAQDLDALKRLIMVLDRVYTHEKVIKGHGELRVGGFTACPGSAIKAILPTLRQAPPPPVQWTPEELSKAIWYNEQLARALRGDDGAKIALMGAIATEPPRPGAHNAIVQVALVALEGERE